MHIVDGKTVEPRDYNRLERTVRFLLRPFVEAWHHRDLIAAILRRELRERFSGSMAGWVWAVVAPLISLVTYTLVFGGSATLPNKAQSNSSIDYALFIVTRYRDAYRENGGDVPAALELAMNTAGRAILFAGATVEIGRASCRERV